MVSASRHVKEDTELEVKTRMYEASQMVAETGLVPL